MDARDLPPEIAALIPDGWRLSISMGPDFVTYTLRRRLGDGRIGEVCRSASHLERREYSPGPLAFDLFFVGWMGAELQAMGE